MTSHFANTAMFVVQLMIGFPILCFRSVGDSQREYSKYYIVWIGEEHPKFFQR